MLLRTLRVIGNRLIVTGPWRRDEVEFEIPEGWEILNVVQLIGGRVYQLVRI